MKNVTTCRNKSFIEYQRGKGRIQDFKNQDSKDLKEIYWQLLFIEILMTPPRNVWY